MREEGRGERCRGMQSGAGFVGCLLVECEVGSTARGVLVSEPYRDRTLEEP